MAIKVKIKNVILNMKPQKVVNIKKIKRTLFNIQLPWKIINYSQKRGYTQYESTKAVKMENLCSLKEKSTKLYSI